MGTALMETSMYLNQVSPDQIMAVLETLHSRASNMHEDDECNLSYEAALAEAFHDMWTATQS